MYTDPGARRSGELVCSLANAVQNGVYRIRMDRFINSFHSSCDNPRNNVGVGIYQIRLVTEIQVLSVDVLYRRQFEVTVRHSNQARPSDQYGRCASVCPVSPWRQG